MVTPAKKLEPFHFSASESDNDENDFSFITKSIEEKIEHMNKVFTFNKYPHGPFAIQFMFEME